MELKYIRERTAKILLIDSNAAIRQVKSATLRTEGFATVTQCPDVKMGISILESEPIDWLICNFSIFDESSAIALLQLINESDQLNHITVSFFISAAEQEYLTTAFSLNLLSYHVSSSQSEDSAAEVTDFLAVCSKHEFDSTLIASWYFRKNLVSRGKWKFLAAWQDTLYQIYPGNPEILLSLGEAFQQIGKLDAANKAVMQATWADPDIKEEATALLEKISKARNDPAQGSDFDEQSNAEISALGFDSCLVVMEPGESQQLISQVLSEGGISSISVMDSADEAIEKLRQGYTPGLVIFDWNNTCPGPVFLQRVKGISKLDVPLVVVSPALRQQDMALMNEMGIDGHFSSVKSRRALIDTLIACARQGRNPTAPRAILRKIRVMFKKGQASNSISLMKKYKDQPSIKEGDRILLDAEFAFHTGRLKMAKTLGMDALKSGGDPLASLTVTGKAMMKLGEFPGAMACMENARMLSPFNLERISQLAEAHLIEGNKEGYDSMLDSARDIDANSQEVLETQAKGAILQNNNEEVSGIFGRLVSLSGIVSFTNNQAIANIRSGKFEEGLALYERVISATPAGRKEIFAIIHYNYAMAHVRMGNNNEALDMLTKANGFGNTRIQRKISSLGAKIKSAQKSHSEVVLNAELQPEEKAGFDVSNEEFCIQHNLIQGVVKINDKACGHTFECPAHEKEIVTILDKKLHFKPRASISRDETISGQKMTG